MRLPRPNAFDTTVYGGLAFLGASAFVGFKHAPDDAEDMGDKVGWGATVLGGTAAAGYAAYKFGPKRMWNAGLWFVRKNYNSGTLNAYRGLKAEATKSGKVWNAAERAAAQSSARWKGRLAVAASAPVAMGAGAVLGAMVGGEDNRGRGAAIGAAVGGGASLLYHGAKSWGKLGPVGKLGVAAGIAGMAAGMGSDSALNRRVQAAAVYNQETGDQEYVDPAAAAQINRGVGRRMRNMNASGNVVLGAHNGRHG